MTQTAAATGRTALEPRSGEVRMVAVDGVRFALRRWQPGSPPTRHGRVQRTPPVLLLHGVPQTGLIWAALGAELGQDRLALAPDLKGLGESEPVAPYDVPTLVRELAALVLHEVEGLPGDGQVDVVGHDWGGSLALALAAARPDLVRRLVVLNAPYRHIDLVHAFHMPLFALPLLPELAFRLGGEALVRRMVLACWRSNEAPDQAALDSYARAYADPVHASAMLAYYRGVVRPRLLRVPGTRRPSGQPSRLAPERTLVVWGADDPVLPLPVGEAAVRDISAAPGVERGSVEMLVVPGVGHFVVDEAPEIVVPAVSAFLRAD